MTTQKPARITGIKHLFAATTYSLAALRRLLNEAAFRHEILFYGAGLGGFAFVRASLTDYLILTILFLFMVAAEALNTALEVIIDHLTTDWAEFARDTKDLGSLAVMCMILANAAFIGYVLWQNWPF